VACTAGDEQRRDRRRDVEVERRSLPVAGRDRGVERRGMDRGGATGRAENCALTIYAAFLAFRLVPEALDVAVEEDKSPGSNRVVRMCRAVGVVATRRDGMA